MPVALFDDDDRITVTDKDLPDVEDGDPDTTYTVRPLDTDTHTALVKACTSDKGFDRASHQRVKELDGALLAEKLLDHVLVGWSGIVRKGVPVPCEPEHKKRLDNRRKAAILGVAGVNQVKKSATEVRAESFRESA
jgi:hypothetical protein